MEAAKHGAPRVSQTITMISLGIRTWPIGPVSGVTVFNDDIEHFNVRAHFIPGPLLDQERRIRLNDVADLDWLSHPPRAYGSSGRARPDSQPPS